MTSNTRSDHGHRDNSPHHIVDFSCYYLFLNHVSHVEPFSCWGLHEKIFLRRISFFYQFTYRHDYYNVVMYCINMCRGKHADSAYVYQGRRNRGGRGGGYVHWSGDGNGDLRSMERRSVSFIVNTSKSGYIYLFPKKNLKHIFGVKYCKI